MRALVHKLKDILRRGTSKWRSADKPVLTSGWAENTSVEVPAHPEGAQPIAGPAALRPLLEKIASARPHPKQMQVAVLFLHLWGLLLGFPISVSGSAGLWELPLALLPVAFFVSGLWFSRAALAQQHDDAAEPSGLIAHTKTHYISATCLVVGVPVTLSAAVAYLQMHGNGALLHLGRAGLLLAIGSLWAYAATAFALCLPGPATSPANIQKLSTAERPMNALSTNPLLPLRRIRLAAVLFTLGALLVGVWAPFFDMESPGMLAKAERFAWAHMAAVVGAGLAVAILGVFLSIALGPTRNESPPRTHLSLWFAMAGLGALTYYLTSFYDA